MGASGPAEDAGGDSRQRDEEHETLWESAPPGDLREKLGLLTLQLVLKGVSDARGPRGRRAHRPRGRGPRARCCGRCLCPLLGGGVPESSSLLPSIRGAPRSQACPPGSQPGACSAQGTPCVSCPSESLLRQVVGRTPGDCSPCPDGREAGALGTCWLFWTLPTASRARQSHGGGWGIPRSGTQRPVHLPGQCSLLQEGGASWRGWANPRGGQPL